jgi:predicted transcriptional regulator
VLKLILDDETMRRLDVVAERTGRSTAVHGRLAIAELLELHEARFRAEDDELELRRAAKEGEAVFDIEWPDTPKPAS